MVAQTVVNKMNAELKIINPLKYPGWDDLLLSNQDDCFFHSSSWAKVLCEAYKYEPLYFVMMEDTRLLALVPMMEVKSYLTGCRGVSLPFSDYCEPVAAEKEYFQETMKRLVKHGKKKGWKSIEWRGGEDLLEGSPHSSHYYEHVLNLSQDREKVFSNFHNNTKRNIRKAVWEGVVVKLYRSLESMNEFYRLHCVTRKKHGLPPQPYHYFVKIFEHVVSKNHGWVVLASHDNKNIAGAVFFHFGQKAIYKYGASDETYQHLRANNLIMWKAIKWFSQNGYQNLSFGRTDPENAGLKRFKEGWGTDERIIKYFKYDVVKEAFLHKSPQLTEFQKRIFSKMPRFLLRTTGALLYKHMG
jgi:hypothetical protein